MTVTDPVVEMTFHNPPHRHDSEGMNALLEFARLDCDRRFPDHGVVVAKMCTDDGHVKAHTHCYTQIWEAETEDWMSVFADYVAELTGTPQRGTSLAYCELHWQPPSDWWGVD